MASKAYKEIMAGALDALAWVKGDKTKGREIRVRVSSVNVPALREKLGLSQHQFANAFGVSLGTVRNWEQGRTEPDGPARVLLNVIEKEPAAVLRAIQPGRKKAA